ncbi:AMP-dependent synthetase [Paracoccus suum]|uniref:AMP-dependent synthetase n=1 Tax=Paracoccus suum TaxID=2259340 RepID=A0A344PM86_9RHOB|nr:AMP-binding protein [Paracoccus suum]AXC50491.1 AMP-dependent synthetase [Paracoccus suum]
MRPLQGPTLPPGDYAAMRAAFRWDLPPRLNMARQAILDRAAAEPARLAMLEWSPEGVTRHSYADLAEMTARLAAAIDPAPGDRVGVLRTQSAWTAAAHAAIWARGAISVPLFKLFGPEALALRLSDAGIATVITDPEGRAMLAGFELRVIVPEEDALLEAATLEAVDTGPQDPAVIIYTSGTTGAPKGALHAHRILTGHLPGVEMSHDRLFPGADVIWTPADWAWIGGLIDVAMPGLALGVPVVAARLPKFTAEAAAAVIADCGVTCAFLPPTALRLLRASDVRLPQLRSVGSAGEPLGVELLTWGRRALGVTINEFYGQTECNMVASGAGSLFAPTPGAIGRSVPGFDVTVIDAAGQPTQSEGEIAIRKGAASMMLGYWQNPKATAEKFHGDWLLTGDRGIMDDGYIRFIGRGDDVITSGGYRIGPTEIEDVLLKHPAVASAAVIGLPDPLRTEAVTACVVLRPGFVADAALAAELQDHARLCAAHSYPRAVHFLDALPMTVTGKVMRRELRAMLTEGGQPGAGRGKD